MAQKKKAPPTSTRSTASTRSRRPSARPTSRAAPRAAAAKPRRSQNLLERIASKLPGRKPAASAKKGGSRKPASRSAAGGKGQSPTRTARNQPAPAPARQPSWWSSLSLDKKLDIAGVVMAVLGVITLLGMLSANNGWLMGGWVTLWGRLLGWGVYFFPVGLLVTGIWLILRNFERVPRLSLERATGLLLFYLLLLTSLHFALNPANSEAAFAQAAQGRGGGYVGGALFQMLKGGFGLGGAAIILLAWLLLALAFTLDRPIAGLFAWVKPLILRIQDNWDEWQAGRESPARGNLRAPPAGAARQASGVTASPQGSATPPGTPASPTLWGSELPQSWVLPRVEDILDKGQEVVIDDDFDRQRAQVIEETLASFGAPAKVVEINRGPTITQFGVEPDFIENRNRRVRVRVGKIATLADDLALALAATRIRVEAPVPGKGYVGIEVPNDEIASVTLRDGIESEAFKRLEGRPLRFSLGQDVAGNAVAADLAAMPHLLIAGTTGSGKSVCVNAIIACLLINNTPDELRFLMVDPKRVELTGYDGIPHLLAPVVVEMERVVGALQWATREMDQRYHKFAEMGARNIAEYNSRVEGQGGRNLPYLVVVIDELADLMMLAPDETERTITRMAQLARATGIHMVISTQRPSVDVVTGLIKANFPARIAFATASGTDSRVILDQPGAERLLGRGDMLFQAPDAAAPVRLQGVFVSDSELLQLVYYWRSLAGYVAPSSVATAAGGVPDAIPRGIPLKQLPMFDEPELEPEEDLDPLFDEAVDLIRRQGRASISMLQRRLRIGYTRAARLIETMEAKGIVSAPQPGSQVRDVLDYGPAAPPVGEA